VVAQLVALRKALVQFVIVVRNRKCSESGILALKPPTDILHRNNKWDKCEQKTGTLTGSVYEEIKLSINQILEML
jgi:hypothetical protein